MYKVEIFANQSLETNILESFEANEIGKQFSLLRGISGKGNSFPKQGDAVWPEENVLYILYCEKEEALKIKELVSFLKRDFKKEGIKFFAYQVDLL